MLGRELLQVEIDFMIRDLKPFKEDNDIMCECGEHKAKWILTDDFMKGWHMNLCDDCLFDMREEYKEEGTSYVVSLIK
ncbi:MAG: hypothetical protein ACRDDH_18205 [Cetobacterium sp.]|uniref:hypothetical protein n=1 Tax=Cetobacterium sp. TaxID=2071632 RepID=UPI003EE77DC2